MIYSIAETAKANNLKSYEYFEYYLRSFTSELPEGIVYIVVGISAFAGALLLYEIIRRIPIICWCVLGLKKEKKDV